MIRSRPRSRGSQRQNSILTRMSHSSAALRRGPIEPTASLARLLEFAGGEARHRSAHRLGAGLGQFFAQGHDSPAGADYRIAARRRRRRLSKSRPAPAPGTPHRRGGRSGGKCAPDRCGRRWPGRHRRPRLRTGRCRRAPARLPAPGRANRRGWRAGRGRRRRRSASVSKTAWAAGVHWPLSSQTGASPRLA